MHAIPEIPKSANDLANFLDVFIDQNTHAISVRGRWLATYLGDVLRIVKQVRDGSLDNETAAKVSEFRRAEIETQKAKKQREIDDLDKELRELSR